MLQKREKIITLQVTGGVNKGRGSANVYIFSLTWDGLTKISLSEV